MLEKTHDSLLHWNYFLTLESDLIQLSRYIEFSKANSKTYSLELVRILLAAGSEVDVVLKGLCIAINDKKKYRNIDDYRETVTPKYPKFPDIIISIPQYGQRIPPWENWKSKMNPDWWKAYNNVKHHRDRYFPEATLQHTIAAVAGLYVAVLYFYKTEAQNGDLRPATNFLTPVNLRKIVGVGTSVFGNSVIYREFE